MTTDTAARIIWGYHQLHHELEKVDAIVVLGSHDLRVAERGAQLYLDDWAPRIIFTGNVGRHTDGLWGVSEAEKFAEVARGLGVSEAAILIENRSTNTGENARFAQETLKRHGVEPKKVIAVTKPYMERRAYATFRKQWPEVEVIVTSPQISYEDYPNAEISAETMLNAMVGDLERIETYATQGFQIAQEIPDEVRKAFRVLVSQGYTNNLQHPDGRVLVT